MQRVESTAARLAFGRVTRSVWLRCFEGTREVHRLQRVVGLGTAVYLYICSLVSLLLLAVGFGVGLGLDNILRLVTNKMQDSIIQRKGCGRCSDSRVSGYKEGLLYYANRATQASTLKK